MADTHGNREVPAPKLVSADDDDDERPDPEIVALGRYLGWGGIMGYVPDWYYLILAADRLHCTPWELLEQSIYWRDTALKAISAEVEAKNIKKQRGIL